MNDEHKETLIAVIVMLILAVSLAWWIYARIMTPAVQPIEKIEIPVEGSPTLGNPQAPNVVVVFSDFQCPFCGEFERESFPQIKAQLIDTGKVYFVFKQFPLQSHEHAYAAAVAATCSHQQGKFWEYHDLLFNHQDALENENLLAYAGQVGLDRDRFKSCIAGGAPDVAADRQLGVRSGVTGTPAFFFNGKLVSGALSYEQFEKALVG
jgi:protein-disulfide isomerase